MGVEMTVGGERTCSCFAKVSVIEGSAGNNSERVFSYEARRTSLTPQGYVRIWQC
jgi:hypothetical protein